MNWQTGNMAIHQEIDALCLSNLWQRDVVHLLAELGSFEELECQAEVCVRTSRKFQAGAAGNQGPGLQVDRKAWPWKLKHASCVHAEQRVGKSRPVQFELGDLVRDIDVPAEKLIVIGRDGGVLLVRPHGGGERVWRAEDRLVPYGVTKLVQR